MRRLSLRAGKRALIRWAGEAAAKPGRPGPPSSCRLAAGAEALQRLHQSTQHQYPLQGRSAKDFWGPEPSIQVEALPSWPRRPNPGQLGACLPNKETKAFVGPGLGVVTSSGLGCSHVLGTVLSTGQGSTLGSSELGELRHREEE